MPGARAPSPQTPKPAENVEKHVKRSSPPTASTPLLQQESSPKHAAPRWGLVMVLFVLGVCFAGVAWHQQLTAQIASLASSVSGRVLPELLVTQVCQVGASVCIFLAAVATRFPASPPSIAPAKEYDVEVPAEARKAAVGTKVQRLMKALGDTQERKQLLAEEQAEEEKASSAEDHGKREVRDASREPPRVQKMEDGELRIAGVYEHQLLKGGLRILDDMWPEEPLEDATRNKLLRPSLISDLLARTRSFQSVPTNDVIAAQCDLRELSVRQLLSLRVANLSFTPSGTGSDVRGTAGGTHSAFVSSNESLLFERLGKHAASSLAGLQPAPNFHHLGRQAVFCCSAARTVPSPEYWAMWLGERRVFFHARKFYLTEEFPAEGGVLRLLEVDDMSKPDTQEPMGRFRWFDWRIRHVTEESQLWQQPARTAAVAEAGVQPPGEGSALGKLNLSPELLGEALSALRKVEVPGPDRKRSGGVAAANLA